MPKEANKKQNRDKKHFMKDFKAELKRVIWPTPKQLLNNTVAVISIVLITAAIVFILDFVFENMNTYGIDKLKAIVDTTNEVGDNELISLENAESSNADNETENSVAENSNNVE